MRSTAGERVNFWVEVGVHQGPALSPFLFTMVMDLLVEKSRKEVPEAMTFADDVVLYGGNEVGMT